MSASNYDYGPFGGFDLNDDGEVDIYENVLSHDDEDEEFDGDFDGFDEDF